MCFQMYLRVHNRRVHDEYQQIYSPGDLEAVQNLEKQTKEALRVLEGNIGVFSALGSFYRGLGENGQFLLRNGCVGDLSSFTHQIDKVIDEAKTYIARGQLIAKIIAARETIVCISALLFFQCNLHSQCTLIIVWIYQHFQSQAIEKTEQLTTSMQSHSLTVRIIAFFISIYLPATFASVSLAYHFLVLYGQKLCQTIFSTDVFKYQNLNSISTSEASGRIKQVVSFPAIALPLVAGHSTNDLLNICSRGTMALEGRSKGPENVLELRQLHRPGWQINEQRR